MANTHDFFRNECIPRFNSSQERSFRPHLFIRRLCPHLTINSIWYHRPSRSSWSSVCPSFVTCRLVISHLEFTRFLPYLLLPDLVSHSLFTSFISSCTTPTSLSLSLSPYLPLSLSPSLPLSLPLFLPPSLLSLSVPPRKSDRVIRECGATPITIPIRPSRCNVRRNATRMEFRNCLPTCRKQKCQSQVIGNREDTWLYDKRSITLMFRDCEKNMACFGRENCSLICHWI